MSEIGADRVRDHLAKVLSSGEFQNSERLCRFLRFTVEALLNGEQDQVKEYLIGKEVFDRNADYDPRLDPIVRVEARRLRKKLQDYYAGPGASDTLRITIPKGAYVPEVRPVDDQPAAPAIAQLAPARRLPRIWIGSALAVVLLVAFEVTNLTRTPVPVPQGSVAVMPARWLWRSDDFPAILHDEDLAERIAANLANRHDARVIAWPSLQRFRGRKISGQDVANELNISTILMVAVRIEADGFRVTAFLIDPKLDRKLRVSEMRNVALQTAADREKAATELASNFAADVLSRVQVQH